MEVLLGYSFYATTSIHHFQYISPPFFVEAVLFCFCMRFSRDIPIIKSYYKMASRRNIRYSQLAVDEDDYYDGHGQNRHDPRFDYAPRTYDKVPWKSIILAIFLLLIGCMLLLLAFFIFTGHMGGESSQAYGLLGLGLLTFVPGFYETRIAYYSWRGAQGYRFAYIPDY